LTDPKYPWDNDPRDMWFHITLAYHLKDRKFRGIKRYLNIDQGLSGNFFGRILDRVLYGRIFKNTGRTPVNPVILPHRGLRITILRHRVIAAEYDLVLKRWLNRSEAKSERIWGQTLQGYRRKNGIQKTKPEYLCEKTIFVIGDLHLGHTNIIRHCCRPFLSSNIQEMDNVLINNWNFTVKQNDTVLFLGDLTHRGGTNPHFYLSKLHGRKIFINGNHDGRINIGTNSLLYSYSGIEFFLTHDPRDTSDIPADFHGWVIHGHVHNNDLKNYPFFDPGNKRVNVSVEAIHYQPIPLQKICDLIESENRGLLLYPGSCIPVRDAGRNKSGF